MKNIFITICLLTFLIGCSKSDEEINTNSHNLQELGLTSENNIYPFYPDTTSVGLMDNRWYDWKNGDTLTVYRRDMVTDDSGDHLYYTFLVKHNQWIVPLNVKRISSDIYLNPPRLNQLMFNKPIVNFRLQKYEEGKDLACEITTPNGDYYLQNPLIDKMWIKLDD